MGSCPAIGYEEGYLSPYEATMHRDVYKCCAACSLLQQTKRPFIRLDPHSLVGDLGVALTTEFVVSDGAEGADQIDRKHLSPS